MIVHGVRIGVRASDTGALEAAIDRLPPGRKPSSARQVDRLYSVIAGRESPGERVKRLSLLYRDDRRLVRSRGFDEVLEILEDDSRRFVAEEARDLMFVHAAVVGWQGRAILVPGGSGSGKTTLAAELVRAGADYYSDEYALLDRRGRVHAYPRQLAFRGEGGRSWRRVRAEELGGSVGERPLPVGLVVLTEYEPGAEWDPARLSPGRGVIGLVAHTVLARRDPEATIRVHTKIVRNAIVVGGTRGDAVKAAPAILELASTIAENDV